MKPILRGITLLTISASLLLSTGCKSRKVYAEETTVISKPAPVTTVAAAPAPPPPPQPVVAVPAPAPRAAIIITNPTPAPVAVAAAAQTNPAPEATPPPTVILSPALGEVVKLVQAGVGESVISAYITNSTDVFDIGADQILYLHDLGLPSQLITALIQKDSTPEAIARRQAAATVPTAPAPEPVATPAPATTTVNNAPAVVYTVPPAQQPVVINQFYDDLAPYGTWVEIAGYGRCWRPTVAVYNTSWRPYSDGGRWVWTDHGWYWYSDYSWGWAPFHYGRWTSHATFGWMWVPDVHWGPAWVSWRTSSSYCAWAPLPPFSTFTIGIGWSYGGRHYRDECDFIPHHRYVALPIRHLQDARPSRHFLASRQTEQTIRASSSANDHSAMNQSIINRGVPVDAVARESGRAIRPVSLRPVSDTPRHTSRREILDADARTMTVSRPTLNPTTGGNSVRTAATPAGSISTPRANTSRPTTGTPTTTGSANPANVRDAGNGNVGSGNADSPRSPRPIIIRGTARPADGANSSAIVAGGAPNSTTFTPRSATPTVVNPNPTTPSQPRGVRNPDSTISALGGRPTTVPGGEAGGRPSITARPSPGNSATPAPVVRVPPTSARTETPRSVDTTSPSRAPSYNAPAPSIPSTPRAAPAPSVNNNPRPASPEHAPRAESSRSSSPSPAPARPSSSGESSPRGSRSSDDDSGRRNRR